MVSFFIQVLKLNEPSIIISYDNQLYIFNVPEGFQRFAPEFGIKLRQSPQIFISRFNDRNVSGLIGLLLTLNFDNMADKCRIMGPVGLVKLIETARNTDIGGSNLYQISVDEFNGQQLSHLKKELQYIKQTQNQNNNTKETLKQTHIEKQYLDVYQDQKVKITPIQTGSTYQYLIQSQSLKGSINDEKLSKLNLSKLQKQDLFKNNQIIIDNVTITVEELRDPPVAPFNILILDIQDDEEIRQLPQFLDLTLVFHLQGINSELYQQFKDTNSTAQHILCNLEIYNNNSNQVPRCEFLCNHLSQYFPNNFKYIQPRPYLDQIQEKQPNITIPQVFHQYTLLPLHKNGYQPFTPCSFSTFNKFENQQQLQQQLEQIQSDVITFLGTASMKPNKYRNVSGILLQLKGLAIILDCGEGTYKQLQDIQFNFNQPVLIWISHIHSDHNLGILSLMKYIKQCYVLIPVIMMQWMSTLVKLFNLNVCVILFQKETDLLNKGMKYINQYDLGNQMIVVKVVEIERQFKIKLQFTEVYHCEQAYAIRIDLDDGFSITYSGDTRPCYNFIKLSLNADIMIHEATFTDDLQENANQTKHSTIREAVECAILSKSKNLILTHFSQRYTKGHKCQQQQQACQNQSLIDDDSYKVYLEEKTVFAVDYLNLELKGVEQFVKQSQIIAKMFDE